MVDVEHCALGAFEEHRAAGTDQAVQLDRKVAEVGSEALGPAGEVCGGGFGIQFGALGGRALEVRHPHDLPAHHRLAAGDQFGQTDAGAADLALVRRADALGRRADAVRAARLFAHAVEGDVDRRQGMGAVGEPEPPGGTDPALLQLIDLAQEGVRVDHHAIAQVAGHPLVQDARGNQVQGEVLVALAAAELHRMAGVVAALEANHGIEGGAQEIDDLPLALVAPLHADDDYVRHVRFPRATCGSARIAPTRGARP